MVRCAGVTLIFVRARLEAIGQELLLDKDGNCLGDDLALFTCSPTSNGDSKGANRTVQQQLEATGPEARGQSKWLPCSTHVGKNFNKALFWERKAHADLHGVGGLETACILATG